MDHYGNIQLMQKVDESLVIYTSTNFPIQFENELVTFYRRLLEQNVILCSGWHSPFEKKMLALVNPPYGPGFIYVMARAGDPQKIYNKFFACLDPNRVLIINPGITQPRISRHSVRLRDTFILEHFRHFCFPYIRPGGHVQELFEECIKTRKSVFVYNHSVNELFFWDSVTLVDPFEMDLFSCLNTLNE